MRIECITELIQKAFQNDTGTCRVPRAVPFPFPKQCIS
ncbi:hypothetical protein OH687_14710 [Burkholderia anthina]|nr:hypothetical protein OH687_14710 [Burkholderia anthina]